MKIRKLSSLHFMLLLAPIFFWANFTYSQDIQVIKQKVSRALSAQSDSQFPSTNWNITDYHTEKKFGLTYVYIRQTYKNIPIYNAVANLVIKGDKTMLEGNRFIKNAAQKTNTIAPKISMKEAIEAAASELQLSKGAIQQLKKKQKGKVVFKADQISATPIPVELMLYPVDSNAVRLAWDLSLNLPSKKHWWSIRIDAVTGKILDKIDWIKHCNIEKLPNISREYSKEEQHVSSIKTYSPPPSPTPSYNVFALPTESPNFGNRTIETDPSDPVASPYKWHDTNGVAGAEFTETKGNNVFAYDDISANNNYQTGHYPDGGSSLTFDFPLNFNDDPVQSLDAAITNLYYTNNVLHDIWYHYGFNEAAGNFQENNYGNGGDQEDPVLAEAQDGSGTNNSNFATPPDGQAPRMQMYLWDGGIPKLLTVNSPSSLAGDYAAKEANFGPGLTTTITSDLVLFNDNSGDVNDGCQNPVNGSAMNGKIVVIRRGSCNFTDKIQKAQTNGATAVIMVNNVSSAPINMGGAGGSITIPSIMISKADGDPIIQELTNNQTVNATLKPDTIYMIDGDYDNGVIAHEFGHGISTRLTGGASNSNCLGNDEQMGEGWSDWFALMLTIHPGDQATDQRGIGTFVFGEPANGLGIRIAPYTTDMSVNGYTYGSTNNTSVFPEEHGLGFIWATILWDLSWKFINRYGFDPDFYNGTGGNNRAMQLVIKGLKLQPCGPGFVDARDAILQADELLYNGEDKCMIWHAFARRGLGYSADEGSPNSRTDQTEAFDLPPTVQDTAVSVSETVCDTYTWNATGNTYTTSGDYTANLYRANGCDSTVTLHLTVGQSYAGDTTAQSCGDFTWHGTTYSSSGDYTQALTNGSGCDSTVTLHLTIGQTSTGDTTATSCGDFTWRGTTYSSSGDYTQVITSGNGCDSTMTLHLTIGQASSGDTTATSCGKFTWYGTNYASSGDYSKVLTTNSGCDSTVTLHLTVNTLTPQIEMNNPPILNATPANANAYQWVDCNKNYAAITGANSSSFEATHNGEYAVIIQNNNCIDTSSCFLMDKLGLHKNELDAVNVYPNPTNDVVTIQLAKKFEAIDFRIYDIEGKLIQEKKLKNSNQTTMHLKGATGIYILEIQTKKDFKRIKISKTN